MDLFINVSLLLICKMRRHCILRTIYWEAWISSENTNEIPLTTTPATQWFPSPYPEKGHGSRCDYAGLSTPLLIRLLNSYHMPRLPEGAASVWEQDPVRWASTREEPSCLFAKPRWNMAQVPLEKQPNSGQMVCFAEDSSPLLLSPGPPPS